MYDNDIGLLVLERPVDMPRKVQFASDAEIEATPGVVVVGYGLTSDLDSGFRQFGTVFIGSTDPERYGCHDYELVAG